MVFSNLSGVKHNVTVCAAMLNRKSRDYGVMKALGFTTGQLILQTALSFMPAAVVSAALGLVVCSFLINPLMALFLSGIGVVKCTLVTRRRA